MWKNIVIEEKYAEMVLNILSNVLDKNYKVYVFGSRTKGTRKKFADLDLAFDNSGQKLSESTLIQLSSEFEKSLLPFFVDIIDINNITSEFKTLIEPDFVKIF